MSRRIEYRVDLDERDEFRATVYDGDTVLAELDTEDILFLVDVVGIKHGRDYRGLREYFTGMGIVDPSDTFEISG